LPSTPSPLSTFSNLNPAQFYEQLADVGFHGGTETLGNHYFIDYCFVGPKPMSLEDCQNQAQDPSVCKETSPPKYATSVSLSTKHFKEGSSLPIPQVSEWRAHWDLACSFGKGDLKPSTPRFKESKPFRSVSSPTTSFFTAPTTSQWVGNLSSDFIVRSLNPIDLSKSSGSSPLWIVGSAGMPLPVKKANGLDTPPEFCLLRLYLMEGSTFENSSLRKNLQAHTQISVNWKWVKD
jgi:hypothetical protein